MTDTDNQAQAEDSEHTPKASGTSPELTGGQGFTFEDAVAAVYTAALLCESTAPGLPGRTVTHISVQQGSFGQPLDDLIVKAVGADHISITLSKQIKRKLIISSAEKNDDFRETIVRAYETIIGNNFKLDLDRVGAIVGEISDASKRAFETLCEWARADSSSESFAAKLRTDGAAGDKLTHFESVRTILSNLVDSQELDHAAHKLLRHFILIRLDLLTEGSPTEAHTVSLLANILAPSDRPHADNLWRRLLSLVRVSQGRAAAFDRKTLVARLNGSFRLSAGPSLSKALKSIEQESLYAIAEIRNTISGLYVPREALVQKIIGETKTPGFVQIAGMPGTGKSVVLRLAIECLMKSGPVLFLKSDRLQGTTWSQYAAASGIPHSSLEDLLIEVEAVGAGVLFIDGIDRIEVAHRGIVLDLIHTLNSSKYLSNWCVVATVRDTGMEPLRTWLPSSLFTGGIRTLTVDSFNDDEAEVLSQEKPALRSLLFGPEAVRSVVRRPFFTAVLAKASDSGCARANSEVDLTSLWWAQGGYAADPMRVGYRRNALVELAKAGAHQLGRRIPVSGSDGQVIAELEADGIIRSVRVGHTVQFVHDIFFEWAFLQYLISEGDNWHFVISQIGEPPALGRVVELLSQTELVHEDNWVNYLETLEADQTLRSQWLRAWMAGPFSLETFKQHSFVFDQAMFSSTRSRVAKLVVWYQAEKTQPNSEILERSDLADYDIAQRMLYADMLGYPVDIATWSRFCHWLLDHAENLPTNIIPDVVSAFGVWQNIFAHYRNPVSERIFQTCLAWLYHIEYLRHRREFSTDYGVWGSLGRDQLEQLEQSLRSLVLNASVPQRTLVAQYLRDQCYLNRLPTETINAVFQKAPLLAKVCSVELVDFTLLALKNALPVDIERESRDQDYLVPHAVADWDWDRLSIDDKFMFSPAAPTREPFHSLLKLSPDEGRRLVRELSNHAIQAWRQLHRLSRRRGGCPIPIALKFPWGSQTFWGDKQRYLGARGLWGPSSVNSGLMALEAWAFEQLTNGTPVDEVLLKTLEGHKSVGSLAVAVAISLHAQHRSEISLPIATNQRIWHLEINRQVHDRGTTNLIGFKPHERVHAKAVRDGNALSVRGADIRSLATLIVLNGGELGAQAVAAIQSFPNKLPFEYVEERSDKGIISELSSTAQIWAEFGKRENYKAKISSDESKIIISLDNPKATGPDVEEIQAKQTEMLHRLRILNWASSYFENHQLNESLTIEDAVKAAKALDTEDLFGSGYASLEIMHQRQAAVAAVAAVVIAAEAKEYLEWAVEVCVLAADTPEEFDEFFIRESKLVFHPVLFAAKGLGAYFQLCSDEDVVPLQRILIGLCADPYEDISIAALRGLLNVWDKHPEVAWVALHLAAELVLVEVQHGPKKSDAKESRQTYISGAIKSALQRISGEIVADALPSLPVPWIKMSDQEITSFRRSRASRQQVEWKLNSIRIDVKFLNKVIDLIPVDVALSDNAHSSQFLDWCEMLTKWTIERVSPSWATNKRELDRSGTDLYEWKSFFYRFLAKVSLNLTAEDGIRRFLEPAMAADDETFSTLCDLFTSYLVTTIADSPEIPPVALQLLSAITERTLKYRGWPYAREDMRYLDSEFLEIIKDLFFSKMPRATLAKRFANGDWTEVSSIIPVFEPILQAHGSVVSVAKAWMSLCEKSLEHYPVEHFVNNLEFLFGPTGQSVNWRHTQLPARLSGLIQRFSERTQPMPIDMAQKFLRALDRLVDMGDRRAAAVQLSEVFRSVRLIKTG